MYAKFTAIFLLGVVASALCFKGEIPRSPDESVQPAPAEEATPEQKAPVPENEKLFPFMSFTAAIRPNQPPPPPPALPSQTLVIPPGTDISVNAGSQPVTITRPGTTLVTQG